MSRVNKSTNGNLIKTCTKCKVIKPIVDFYEQGMNKDGTRRFCSHCKACQLERKKQTYDPKKKSEYNKVYREAKKDLLNEFNKLYRIKNLDRLKLYQKEYRKAHKEENKEYQKEYRKTYIIDKEHASTYRKQYEMDRRASNPAFKLNDNVSRALRSAIKKDGISTNKILLNIGYTINDLKLHLEKQFESWMSWQNYGVYKKSTWVDDDKSTWTWSIDHIVPQSTFEFSSSEDPNFKLCWSLNNLRPLSSKVNLMDGCTRKRHNK